MENSKTLSSEAGMARTEMTRRRMLGMMAMATAVAGGVSALTPWAAVAAPATPVSAPVSPAEALDRLRQGNTRYASGKAAHPDQSILRRTTVALAQHPFAALLSCVDSRVSPEIVFDQGIGDLFDIRVAGNIVDPAILGSLEYGVEHLGIQLIVVLGHERCGAVTAAVARGTKGTDPGAHLVAFVNPILPAVKVAQGMKGDLVENTVLANVRMVAAQLRAAGPILKEAIDKGELTVIGARYDLDLGVVTFNP